MIWLEVLGALLLAFVIFLLWGYLRQQTGSDKYDRIVANRKIGIDEIGIAVSCFCHDGKGKYLLEKRSANARDEQGRWNPGGGTVEFGETIEDAIRRELKEEYCVDVLGHEFLGYRDVHREINGRKSHWILLDFKVLIDPAQAKIGEPDVIDELRWVTIDDIPTPMHSFFPAYLEKYKGKL